MNIYYRTSGATSRGLSIRGIQAVQAVQTVGAEIRNFGALCPRWSESTIRKL